MPEALRDKADGAAAPTQSKYSFFISRAGKDKDIALLIAQILRTAGATTFLQEDFGPTSFMAKIAEGWGSGARLICILSKSYQNSEYTKKEYEVVLAHDPRNLKQRVIVLRVEDGCQPIEHLTDLAYTDLVPYLNDATVLAKVVRGAVGLAADQSEVDVARVHIRARQIVHAEIWENKSFVGRKDDIERLHDALWSTGSAALTNTTGAAALSGLGASANQCWRASTPGATGRIIRGSGGSAPIHGTRYSTI